MEQLVNIFSIAGTFAFAISGALTAMSKKFDPFGVFIIAFATAVGGGTVRDVLISSNSVFWLVQPLFIYIIMAGAIFAMLFRRKLSYLRKTLLLFDTIGLGLYTIIGVQIGIEHELSGISCVALGTVTGAFGGVLRDILVNDVPVIFKKEIYATISIAGGTLYLILTRTQLPALWLQLIPIFLIISVRLMVVYFGISFPAIYHTDEEEYQ